MPGSGYRGNSSSEEISVAAGGAAQPLRPANHPPDGSVSVPEKRSGSGIDGRKGVVVNRRRNISHYFFVKD